MWQTIEVSHLGVSQNGGTHLNIIYFRLRFSMKTIQPMGDPPIWEPLWWPRAPPRLAGANLPHLFSHHQFCGIRYSSGERPGRTVPALEATALYIWRFP